MGNNLTKKDAEYLRKYIDICEDFVSGDRSLSSAEGRLCELNDEFKEANLSRNILRDKIPASWIDEDDWYASSYEC